MRRLIRTVGWVGLACLVIGAAATAVVVARVNATHPRDEAGYLRYVERYSRDGDGTTRALNNDVVVGVSDDQLIEAGDRACDWLSRQPPALFMTGWKYRQPHLTDRYHSAMPDSDWEMPRQVIPAAWKLLCPATMQLVKPHYVFSTPGD